MTAPEGERIAALERDMAYMKETIVRMSKQLDEVYGVLVQARGIKWVFIALAALVGFFVSKIAPFLSAVGLTAK